MAQKSVVKALVRAWNNVIFDKCALTSFPPVNSLLFAFKCISKALPALIYPLKGSLFVSIFDILPLSEKLSTLFPLSPHKLPLDSYLRHFILPPRGARRTDLLSLFLIVQYTFRSKA